MILKIKLLLFQYVNTGGPKGRLFRVSKKWLNTTFLSFTGFASRIRSRAAKPAKYENLWVFIRSDAHVVRAGWNIRGCGPLSTPGFFDNLKGGSNPAPFSAKKSSEEFGERQSEKRTQHSRVKKQNAAPSRALSGTVALKSPPGLSPPANRVFNGKAFALPGPRAFGPLRG